MTEKTWLIDLNCFASLTTMSAERLRGINIVRFKEISVICLGLLPALSWSADKVNSWNCKLVDTSSSFGKGEHALILAGREITLTNIQEGKLNDKWLYKVLQADVDGGLRAYRLLNNRQENTHYGGELYFRNVTLEGMEIFITYSDSEKQAVGIATGRCTRLGVSFAQVESQSDN